MSDTLLINAILDNNKGYDTYSIIAHPDDPKVLISSLQVIEKKIAKIKSQVHEEIIKTPSFIKDLSNSEHLESLLQTLFSEIENTNYIITDDIYNELLFALNELNSIRLESQQTSQRVIELNYLSLIHKSFKLFENYLDIGNINLAAQKLQKIEYDVVQSPLDGTQIHSILKIQVKKCKEDLSTHLEQVFSEAILFESKLDHLHLIVNKNVRWNNTHLKIQDIFAALLEMNVIDSHLSHLKKQIMNYIILTYMKNHENWEMDILNDSISPKFELRILNSNSNSNSNNIFTILISLFRFLAQYVFTNNTTSYPITYFGKLISTDLSNIVIQEYLKPKLPLDIGDLKSYDTIALNAMTFTKDLQNLGFFGIDNGISDFIRLLDVHYAIKKRDKLFEQARLIILNEDFHMEIISQVEEIPHSNRNIKLLIEKEVERKENFQEKDVKSHEKKSDSTPSSGKVSQSELPDEPDGSGWGFDEDSSPTIMKDIDETNEVNNGWEFEDPTLIKENILVQDEIIQDEVDDGWGFGLEDVPVDSLMNNDINEEEKGWSFDNDIEIKPVEKTNQDSSTSIEAKVEDENFIQTIVQTFAISANSKLYINLIREILFDAKELLSIHFENANLSQAASRLMSSTSEVIDFYRAVMPTLYSQSLKTVPAFGFQFYNDCNFICFELEKLEKEFKKENIFPLNHLSYNEAKIRLRHLGQRYYQLQLDQQELSIMETLEQAENFTDISNEVKFEICQKSLEAVKFSIRNIAKVLFPILSRTKYDETIGIFIEMVIAKMTDDIEDLFDISEPESINLGQLCRMLHDLDLLFIHNETEQTTIAIHVPHWLKFNYLSEILEASMADIMYLFRSGALVDFSKKELEQLICALFSDTPLRAKNLDEIKKTNTNMNLE